MALRSRTPRLRVSLFLVLLRSTYPEEPAAKPIEKAIFWRILQLLKLNVRLIFVFDGPHRPHKRKRPAGRVPYNSLKLLKQTLAVLRVPSLEALGEAEAECAALQRAGLVDAVWSEDGDSLMFGCGVLISNHRTPNAKKAGGTEKSRDLVRVHRAQDIEREFGLDVNGLVMFAMLSGGDYDITALPGCGPKYAAKAAHKDLGLAAELSVVQSQSACHVWSRKLEQALRDLGKLITVPAGFPVSSVQDSGEISQSKEVFDRGAICEAHTLGAATQRTSHSALRS